VLKVGHHGSSTSSSEAFLDRVRPRLAVVSVGAGNFYGHPSDDVLASLKSRGVHVLRTDEVGSMAIRLDGKGLSIRTSDAGWELQPRR
jgi:competence protein ComEC